MSDLSRFHEAQKHSYRTALAEIRRGRKCSCWMWYIFPQLRGLGHSATAQYYGITGLQEARDYLRDEVLGGRLVEISRALLDVDSNDPVEVMGVPDNLKLKSSMTLFEAADPGEDTFGKVLDKFFHGQRDERTLALLGRR